MIHHISSSWALVLRTSRFLFRDCRSFSFLVHQLSRLFLSVKGYCVDMINKIKHGFVQIWNFSSRVQLDISLVSYRVELSKRNSLSTRVYVYKRATYLWNLIRSMIEAVSKNGDKIHRDELHSALRVGIQKMENYEYPYNLLMSMFWGGGGSGIADLRKDRCTWESTAHGYLTISGYVWSYDSWWPSSHDVSSHDVSSHDNPRNQRKSKLACDREFILHVIDPSNSQIKVVILLPVNHTILIM